MTEINEELKSRIKEQIENYREEVSVVRTHLDPKYCAAGRITIFNPSQKNEHNILTDVDGLELSYDAVKDKTFWHLDKTRRVWTLQDVERFRRNSKYLPPDYQKEFAGNVREFEYTPQQTFDFGMMILAGQKVGPLEHELLANIKPAIGEEIGVHMTALGKYLIETYQKGAQ